MFNKLPALLIGALLLGGLALFASKIVSSTNSGHLVVDVKVPKLSPLEQRGEKLFGKNCAACHGKRGEGAPDWKKIGPDGKYPAPPLNGTGHAWHHPLSVLFRVVKHGSPGGQGNMPPWREKLSDEEILAAIAWFQSKWRQEIYENWAKRDAASRG